MPGCCCCCWSGTVLLSSEDFFDSSCCFVVASAAARSACSTQGHSVDAAAAPLLFAPQCTKSAHWGCCRSPAGEVGWCCDAACTHAHTCRDVTSATRAASRATNVSISCRSLCSGRRSVRGSSNRCSTPAASPTASTCAHRGTHRGTQRFRTAWAWLLMYHTYNACDTALQILRLPACSLRTTACSGSTKAWTRSATKTHTHTHVALSLAAAGCCRGVGADPACLLLLCCLHCCHECQVPPWQRRRQRLPWCRV